MHAMLNIAIRAARAAGNVILRNVDRAENLPVDSKQHNDFVTDVDRNAESEIIRTIHRSYRDHAFLAEESGTTGESDYVWIIDPLDGTTNFLHGFPAFSVSIALEVKGQLECAVVFDPLRNELFAASKGGGATLNDRRIRVSKRRGLDGALLGTGFPFREGADIDLYLRMFKPMLAGTAGVRRAGSAALDLSYVACGRLDGFWELGLKPWDMAAGVLLIREAGGIVTDFRSGDRYLETGNLIAGNPKVHAAMDKILMPFARENPRL
ncbi:MAG: inositol monophosphatase [Chromatiales bacterium]|nr:inositol monophosphatase [Chromatiales bacterium]